MSEKTKGIGGTRRGFIEVLSDILKSLSKGDKGPTRIVYTANLNFRRLPSYLEYLEKIGLVVSTIDHDSKKYSVTEKGRQFLKRYGEMLALIDET